MVDTPRKTFPELQALSAPVVDSDLLAVYRSPGPAKRTTASVLSDYIKAFFSPSTGAALVGSIQTGTGAVTRTLQARGRDRVSIFDFIPVAEHAAILAGNGASTYDCTAALNAAIASVSVNAEAFLLPGPEIWFPPGWYEFASTVEIDKTVSLVGGGCGMNGGQSTVLNWPAANMGGLVFLWTNSPNARTAAASKITGLYLKGGGGSSGHGIWARCRVSLEDVSIGFFGGSGFFANADTAGTGTLRGNVNLSALTRVWSHDNAGWGVYLEGVDANACVLTDVDMSTNTLGGYFDGSLLGNTLIGCHTATNVGPAYKTTLTTAGTVLVGCYQEADQPASELVRSTVVLGGTMAPLLFSSGSQAPYLSGGEFGLEVNRGVISKTLDGSANIITSSVGAPTGLTDATVQQFSHGALSTSVLRTRFFNSANLTTNVRGLDGAQISAVTFEGTTVENGRGASDPFAYILENLVIGSGPNTFDGRHVAFGTAAPTTGAHGRGEIVWNKNFAGAGSIISWHCSVAGTPGTWVAVYAPLIATQTFDPGSLATNAATALQTVTVTGAALGDAVDVTFSLDAAGVQFLGFVSAADTVKYYAVNLAGANPVDLASGTVRVLVRKS
jgi:hypothetical protein